MTALYDAIGHTVIETDRRLAQEGRAEMKVLVVVLTDGQENSSTDHTAASRSQLVHAYEERGFADADQSEQDYRAKAPPPPKLEPSPLSAALDPGRSKRL
jgi:hypothetical protein